MILRAWLLAAVGVAAADEGWSFWSSLRLVSGFLGLDHLREKKQRRAQLAIIGAGFSRTGTKSMETALSQLGYQIYDMRSMLQLGHVEGWLEAAQTWRRGNSTALEKMLQTVEELGYTATLDLPMNLLAPALAEIRPSAKVVMTVRPLEEWLESWANVNEVMSCLVVRPWRWLVDLNFNQQMLKVLYDFHWPYPEYPEHVRRPLPWFEIVTSLPGFEPSMREEWLQLHRRLQQDLEPMGRRVLVFDVRQGWPVLAEFLEVPIPEGDFPRTNSIAGMRLARRVLDVLAAALPLWVPLALWLLWVLMLQLCCCFLRLIPRMNLARRIWKWKHPKAKTK
ncbi:unnamed protein product [Effrenium voratum]|uniref:Uncharacterized protein n=1 Tax=Effrenium voratum TaxID=2562239 RepID=A0AA36ICV9_9DINO|nr:unnamed protein product [Effrenium voratum]CAJ1453659.1 unnamed protein product [Effrenium voratum]